MENRFKFDETKLPSIESFYNTLNDEPLSVEDYECAQNIWTYFKIKNLHQYHDHYLLSGVLLLADVFKHFRQDVLQKHGLDCLYYPTLPSLAWSMALKHTGAELDLITDEAIYLTFENPIRRGFPRFLIAMLKLTTPSSMATTLQSPLRTSYIWMPTICTVRHRVKCCP